MASRTQVAKFGVNRGLEDWSVIQPQEGTLEDHFWSIEGRRIGDRGIGTEREKIAGNREVGPGQKTMPADLRLGPVSRGQADEQTYKRVTYRISCQQSRV